MEKLVVADLAYLPVTDIVKVVKEVNAFRMAKHAIETEIRVRREINRKYYARRRKKRD